MLNIPFFKKKKKKKVIIIVIIIIIIIIIIIVRIINSKKHFSFFIFNIYLFIYLYNNLFNLLKKIKIYI